MSAQADPPPPLDYSRPDRRPAVGRVAAVALVLVGLAAGLAGVAVAGGVTALLADGHTMAVPAALWFAAAGLLGVGLVTVARRNRHRARPGGAGRYLLLGLLIGSLLTALVEGTCFTKLR